MVTSVRSDNLRAGERGYVEVVGLQSALVDNKEIIAARGAANLCARAALRVLITGDVAPSGYLGEIKRRVRNAASGRIVVCAAIGELCIVVESEGDCTCAGSESHEGQKNLGSHFKMKVGQGARIREFAISDRVSDGRYATK